MTATDHRLRLFQKQLASQGASTDETSIEGETRATLVCCVRFTKSCDSGFSRNALSGGPTRVQLNVVVCTRGGEVSSE